MQINNKNSNVKLLLVDDELQLQKFIKQNVFGEKIYIGMVQDLYQIGLKIWKIFFNGHRGYKISIIN